MVAERWVEAQGGDPDVWSEPGAAPARPATGIEVAAPSSGWVSAIDARGVGEAARWLGAGRLHPDQAVDHAVGIELLAKVGDRVEAGRIVARIHARDGQAAERAGSWWARASRSPRSRSSLRRWCWRRGGAVPELPEVETIRRQLAERMPGRTFVGVEVRDPQLVRPEAPAGLRRAGRRGSRVAVGRPARQVPAGASSTTATRSPCTCG